MPRRLRPPARLVARKGHRFVAMIEFTSHLRQCGAIELGRLVALGLNAAACRGELGFPAKFLRAGQFDPFPAAMRGDGDKIADDLGAGDQCDKAIAAGLRHQILAASIGVDFRFYRIDAHDLIFAAQMRGQGNRPRGRRSIATPRVDRARPLPARRRFLTQLASVRRRGCRPYPSQPRFISRLRLRRWLRPDAPLARASSVSTGWALPAVSFASAVPEPSS